MTLGTAFSGAGGFELGFHAAGFRSIWAAEIQSSASDVLAKLLGDAPNLGDVQCIDAESLEVPDVFAWGSPCQDLSSANTTRAGLAGNHSSLFYDGIRILESISRRRTGPLISIWENVAGALTSSGGNDFRQVLHSFFELRPDVLVWRILDGQFFGVPQRRRRVIVAAGFGVGRRFDLLCDAETSRLWLEACQIHGMELPERCVRGTLTARNPARSARPDALIHWCIKTQHPRYELSPGYIFPHNALTTHPTRSLSKHSIIHSTILARKPRDCWMRGTTFIQNDERFLRWRTPLESERLMGWPDNWTQFGASGAAMSNAARYLMTGNGVIAPMATWLAYRCLDVFLPKDTPHTLTGADFDPLQRPQVFPAFITQ